MRTCDKCVPAKEHDDLRRLFDYLLGVVVFLLITLCLVGWSALEWRKELSETQHQLDKANAALMDKSCPVFVKMGGK